MKYGFALKVGGEMKCIKCEKDLTNSTYKISYQDKALCWICYRKIPVKERIKAISK